MNPNYALRVKEDLDKLLDVGFIYPIKTTQWLSPLVIVPKKKKKTNCVYVWIIKNKMPKPKMVHFCYLF
jgi:hypothetical protein